MYSYTYVYLRSHDRYSTRTSTLNSNGNIIVK